MRRRLVARSVGVSEESGRFAAMVAVIVIFAGSCLKYE